MIWLRRVAVMMAAVMAVPAQAASLDAYGRLPAAANVEISPDGSQIALVASSATDRQIQIRRLPDLALTAALRIGDTKVIGLQWAGPDHLVIVSGATTSPVGLIGGLHSFWLATILDIKTSKASNPLDTYSDMDATISRNPAAPRMNTIFGWPRPEPVDGKEVVFLTGEAFHDNRGQLTIYRVDLGAARPSEITSGTEDTAQLLVDDSGHPMARADYQRESGSYSLYIWHAGGWHEVHREMDPIDWPTVEGLGRTKSSLIVEKDENDVSRYHELPLSGGDWSAPITALDDTELIHDPVSRTVLGGIRYSDMAAHYIFLDPTDQQIWDKVVKAFPGETVWLASWSDDRSKVILKIEGPKNGAAFYLLDRATHSAAWLFDEYPGVAPEDFNEVRVISYPAGDGMTIPAYLTLPRGAVAKDLPLVVFPHGGPEARDEPGFDWWAQAIASLGYAVLQPQFRGSSGISAGFVSAGFGQWGRKMQTDLSDGISYLTKQGIVDPAKVCIVGASYGGYAAMAGVTLQSGIYRCAVAVAGVSNLRRHLTDVALKRFESNDDVRRYYLRFLGAKDKSDPVVDEISPALHADKLSAPLLLIHGSIDTVVEPAQSKIMQEAAAKAGKTVQLVTLPGEDRNLYKGATRLQMLQAMAAFLKTNLPPAAMTPAPAATTASR